MFTSKQFVHIRKGFRLATANHASSAKVKGDLPESCRYIALSVAFSPDSKSISPGLCLETRVMLDSASLSLPHS